MSRRADKTTVAGRLGGWMWFQQPVTCRELVQIMFERGVSQKEAVARLSGRFSVVQIKACWVRAYRNRPRRPAADWRPRVLVAAEARCDA